jgi:hypothetical protein
MECVHKPKVMGKIRTRIAKYDGEKITKIREKIELVFGRLSTCDDVTFSERIYYFR